MRIVAGMFLALTLCLAACGKRGPLIYPDMLNPAQPSAVSVHQTGQALKLSFELPTRDRAGRGIGNLAGVMIHKRASTSGQAPGCSACTADFSLFRRLFTDAPLTDGAVQRYGGRVLLLDSDVRVGDDYTYTVTPFTRDNIEGQASAPVRAGMVQPPPPPALKAHSEPTEIQLSFSAPPPGLGHLVGFNLYRAVQGQALPFLPLNREPLVGKEYVDIGLARNTGYVYVVRSVVMMPNGEFVESGSSNEVTAQLANE